MNPTTEDVDVGCVLNKEKTVGERLVWVLQDIGTHQSVYLWAGIPIFLVMTFFMVWSIALGIGYSVFVLSNGGAQATSVDLWFLLFVYAQLFVLLPLLFFTEISVYRTIWAHLHRQDNIGGKTVFASLWASPVRTVAFVLLSSLLLLLSLLFCFLPVLFFSLLRPLAVCGFVVDGHGPVRAYTRALYRFKDDFSYYFRNMGMGVLLNMALCGIPVVGPHLGYVLGGALHLKAYERDRLGA